MNLITLMRKIAPYVRPYKWLVVATLVLTLIGSLIAQVNAVVLDRTVDAINALIVPEGFEWSKAAHILTVISIILLGKEVLHPLCPKLLWRAHAHLRQQRPLPSRG